MIATTEASLEVAGALLAPWAAGTANPAPERLDVCIAAEHLVEGVEALVTARWGYLAAITGLDPGPATGELEVLYHFCSGPAVLTLRVRIPRTGATVPTVCRVIPSATLFERELIEMFGVTVEGTPDPSRLFLPEEWPDAVFPLRKDAELPARAEEKTS